MKIITSFLLMLFIFLSAALGDSRKYRPPVCIEIKNHAKQVIDYACPKPGFLRIWSPLAQIDRKLQEVVVFMEDAKFFSHGGVDAEGIVYAVKENIKQKKFARGGSTITQQLVKNLFLTKEKSIFRKLTEFPLAVKMEAELKKTEILELYLNTIEWGPGIYGAEAASRLYFDKPAKDLTNEEVWLLGLMIPNPKELCLWVKSSGKASLVKRAHQLKNRYHSEKKIPKEETEIMYQAFLTFLDIWAGQKPETPWDETREYPALWSLAPSMNQLLGFYEKFSKRLRGEKISVNFEGQNELFELGFTPVLAKPSKREPERVSNQILVLLNEHGKAQGFLPYFAPKKKDLKLAELLQGADPSVQLKLLDVKSLKAGILF